jgi:subtilisin family serine protease
VKSHTCRLAGALAAIAAIVVVATGSQATAGPALSRYIVQLSDAPLASYRGGVPGLAPTNPSALGAVKLDPTSAASRAYLGYLDQKQAAFRTSLTQALGRAVAVPFSYRYAYNGIAAVLTEDEAGTVSRLSGVSHVEREQTLQLQSDAGPAWIGAASIWNGSATGGPRGTMGEGVVVGDIDTGINHDHPSFAGTGGDGFTVQNGRGTFYGLCAPVTGLPFCNGKLIGVYDFTGTSPEDDNEHGSHTASTAVGNVIPAAVLHAPTVDITRKLSGVAPHANLITYKACTAAGCLSPATTAAIDQAVADGVDVINFSIGGGSRDPWADANSDSFLGARDAGVFASVSAGNDGPAARTMGSPANAPWVTAVAATTHNRKFVNALTGMSGGTNAPATMSGAGVTTGYGPAKIVYAGDFGAPLCGAGPALPTGDSAVNPFPPGTFHGEIVVCDRGTYGRVAKGNNVKAGGAGGYVLANDQASGDSLIGDAFALPGVAISYSNGLMLKQWLATPGEHTATIAGESLDLAAANGDQMASFSSRGPDKSVPDVLKPDIGAPGVDVLAAVHTTDPLAAPEYGILSGTSMAAPHLAGAAALVRALRPTWTPAEVQSALMTTAKTSVTEGGKAVGPFARGAGRVDLTKAAIAGLVLNETAPNYLAADPSAGGDPTTLNIASLASSGCEATCTWTRTVTSSLATTAKWTASVTKPKSVGLTVTPASFTIAPGASQVLTVKADVSKLAVGQWLEGEIRLAAGSAAPAAHLPVTIFVGRSGSVSLTSTGTSGSATVSVTSKVAIKSFQSRVWGLTKGVVKHLQMTQDAAPLLPYDSPNTSVTLIDVPAGSKALAAAITAATSTDVDLYVGRDSNGDGLASSDEEVCSSASEVALESCQVPNPSGGRYWVLVQNWLTGQGLDDIDLAVAVVPGTSNGNLTVSGPATSIPAGTPFDVSLSWNEPSMAVDDAWFALVEYGSDRQHPTNAGSLLVRLTRTG